LYQPLTNPRTESVERIFRAASVFSRMTVCAAYVDAMQRCMDVV